MLGTFLAPAELCTAVKDEVEKWQLLGVTYFTTKARSATKIQLLDVKIRDLKQRKLAFSESVHMCQNVAEMPASAI